MAAQVLLAPFINAYRFCAAKYFELEARHALYNARYERDVCTREIAAKTELIRKAEEELRDFRRWSWEIKEKIARLRDYLGDQDDSSDGGDGVETVHTWDQDGSDDDDSEGTWSGEMQVVVG